MAFNSSYSASSAADGSTTSAYRQSAYVSLFPELPSLSHEPSRPPKVLRLPALDYRLARPSEGRESIPDLVPHLTVADVGKFLSFICSVAILCEIFYIWRPYLRDPNYEMVLETAVAGGCDAIVTYNHRDFEGAEKFGIQILSPKAFLQQIGELA